MRQKGNVTITSIIVALIALTILIISLIVIISNQSDGKANVKNVINPSDQYSQSDYTPNTITYSSTSGSDDNEDPDLSIPDITIYHGQTYILDLDSYADDDEDSDSKLDFDVDYNPSVTPAPISINYDDSTHILTITEINGSWIGTQSINVEVEDTDNGKDDDTFTVTITNAPVGVPVISTIPDVTFSVGTTENSIDLDDYVTDSDHTDSQITWTVTGNININVAIGTDHVVSFTSAWIGSEIITFRATDPLGNYAEDTITVTTTAFNNPAVWNTLTNQNIEEDSAIGTIVYTNILGECTDVDSTVVVSVNSTNFGFVLGLTGNDLTLNAIQPNWWGTQTVVMDCNGVLASFDFTVNRILDDCITICSTNNCQEYCD